MVQSSYRRYSVSLLFLVITIFLSQNLLAHDNDVVHPGFSRAAATLAGLSEISDHCFFDISTDSQCSFIDEGSVKEDLFLDAASSWNPDIWGDSICNGISNGSWINHAYNPVTSGGWWDLGGIDTLTYCCTSILYEYIWDRALWEYTYGSQDDAFFRLGRVCHLLEDMTSPAHVHGDVHVPLVDPDDFETWGEINFASYNFSSMGLTPEIPTGTVTLPSGVVVNANSIRGILHSLALFTYNVSSFQGHLKEVAGTQPDSELARMFPTLHYYDGGILGDNYWEIDNIGGFEQIDIDSDNWWPCTGNYSEYYNIENIRHIEGNFYIENASGNDGELTPEVFDKPGVYQANPNTQTLQKIYGDVLFSKAVSYVAGLYYVFIDSSTALPQPTITVNGSHGSITVPRGDAFELTISIDPGYADGQEADWWFGVVYYSKSLNVWIPISIGQYQSALFSKTPESHVIDTSGVPEEGAIIGFLFMVDLNANWLYDANLVFSDTAIVHIVPGM
jgi:hypothetical protein